jgi:hypothetical protein
MELDLFRFQVLNGAAPLKDLTGVDETFVRKANPIFLSDVRSFFEILQVSAGKYKWYFLHGNALFVSRALRLISDEGFMRAFLNGTAMFEVMSISEK